MKCKSRNIVYISSIAWNYTWHRQQELMSILSKNSFNILFVQPVEKKRLINSNLTRINNTLWILSVSGLPYERCLYSVDFINGKISYKAIEKAINKIGFDDYIVWFDRIHGCDVKKFLKKHYVIYDLIDEILAFGRIKNKNLLLKKENKILKECELLISSSNSLMKRKIHQANRIGENIFLPNGVDCKRFVSSNRNINRDRIIVGFIGTISQRALNFTLIKKIAKLKPEWKYVFVGPGKSEDKKILDDKNIQVYNAVNGHEIPGIIEKFDVGIIPYNVETEEMDYVFPRKACEYLAAGKPVVSTTLKEIKILKPYVRTADIAEEFVQEIENALFENISNKQRIEFVKKFDWIYLTEMLIKKIT
ncbi:glycosyltransferase [Thomasclavelia cocleata]|uniref:glycosyltransferase n=1 Tax=Thomasclavelia cocleata TaxID=69824 RepID=UPI0025583B13|nr:glycosyltransferase [Thomasclavelia cocleata]